MNAPRKRSENYVATTLGEELLIVDLDGGELFSLTGTGKAIFEAIDARRSEADIVALMCATHDGSPDVIAKDVARMLADLEAAALIERSP